MSWRSAKGAAALGVGLAFSLLAPPSRAHDLQLTETLVLLKVDGTYQVDLTCDLDALALGVGPEVGALEAKAALESLTPDELQTKVATLREMLARRVRLRFDGLPAQPRVELPDATSPGHSSDSTGIIAPSLLGLTARFVGRLPADAQELSIQVSSGFPPVLLTVLDQASATGRRLPLQKGEESPKFPLGRPLVETATSGGAAGRLDVAARYLLLGFLHILPKGLDHILFVLGLFLLSARWRPLLWQVTAFTAAHTISLALATFGVVELPSRVVEPLIALSIAYVAIENTLTQELKPWRPFVVFAFGLLHGLGFAGVLAELGLPQGEAVAALLSFNVGVELGQLAVLAAAFVLLGAFRDRPWYRRRVVIPLSLAIAAVGIYWAITRAMGG